jgi:hypothetical protein
LSACCTTLIGGIQRLLPTATIISIEVDTGLNVLAGLASYRTNKGQSGE